MVMSFRVSELQVLLGFAGRTKSGRKHELLAKALKNSEITESYKYVKTLDKTAESCTILASLDGVDYDVTINADGLVNTINAHVAK